MDVNRLAYLGVLLFVLVGCLWLEFAMRTRVFRRVWRLLLSMVLPVLLFTAWDAYAISAGHWYFDRTKILDWQVVAGVPLDEILFFLVIPLASVLTLEGVRSVSSWRVGDEAEQ
ncbi:MAG: lycopene cyclase domain-containing protein [Candidatus Nanopelagicales bacterium]